MGKIQAQYGKYNTYVQLCVSNSAHECVLFSNPSCKHLTCVGVAM